MNTTSFNEQNAFQHIQHLSQQIGPRLIGAENCKAAADYIRSCFKSYGLPVQEQAFAADSVELIHHSVEILDPPLGVIPSIPFLFTPDTPKEGVTGEVLFVEEGEEGFLAAEMKGRIVLWSPRTRGVVPRDLARHQPLGVIVVSDLPGLPPRHDIQHKNFFAPHSPVTAFRISWEDAHRLVQSGVRQARLKLKSKTFASQGRNIIAELKGEVAPEEIIVISAHYDSPPDTPSATDNASGTAMVLELARVYANRSSRRTLRFIAFDGEEAGYLGSAHYVSQLKRKQNEPPAGSPAGSHTELSELDQHLFCLNMDVVGMALGYNSCHVQGPPEITAAVKVLSRELGIPHQVVEGTYGSDNDSFALAGIPGVNFGKMGSSFYYIHTDRDSLDLVNKKQLQKLGTLVDVFISRYAANAMLWPFERNVPEAQMKSLAASLERWMGAYFKANFSELLSEKMNDIEGMPARRGRR